MNEQTIIIQNIKINYLRKPAKKDTKHLIFVFSGFSGDGKPTYNWNNVLLSTPAEIVWIKDFFENGESYYLCANGNLNIEKSIHSFMEKIINELNLNKHDCTVMGGSKGGAAALYYGMKYDFKNIVAVVPQFEIGSYVEIDWPYAFRHMMGNLSQTNIKTLQKHLDDFIPNAIRTANSEKNIYLITSHSDPQFSTEIEPHLYLFDRFKNFNLIFADSELITKHNQVNRHTVSITVGLANLLSMGLPPVFTTNQISYKTTQSEGHNFLKPLVILEKLHIESERLYIEGIAIIQGIPCPEYSDITYKLIFKNEMKSHIIPLAKGNKPNLSDKYELDNNCAYYKGWFCTLKYEGILLTNIPFGAWQCFLEITAKGITKTAPLRSKSISNENNYIFDSYNISFTNQENILNVQKF